jgi:MoaA/NifB/PqqE/SkfB family radical SAM enzyme
MEFKDKAAILKELISLLLLKKTVPFSVNFSLTDQCNFNCEYCETAIRNSRELELNDIIYIIDQLKQCGCKRIGFTGGEPLLRKDLKEIIDYAKRCRIITTLSSNGSLIVEKINEIKKLDMLNVSLNGPEPVHNHQSGRDSFKRVVEGIKIAQGHKIKVCTTTVLTKYNTGKKCLEAILALAKRMGFFCFFQPLCDSRLSLKEKKWPLPDPQEFRNALDYLILQKTAGLPVGNSISGLSYFRNGWEYPAKKKKCWAGKAFFYIDTDGRLYSCLGMIKHKRCIDLSGRNLREVLQTEKFTLPDRCDCWCSTFTEMGLVFSGNLEAVMNLRRFLN